MKKEIKEKIIKEDNWEKELLELIIDRCWLDKGDKEVFNSVPLIEFIRSQKALSKGEGKNEVIREIEERFPKEKHTIDQELYENSGGGEMCEACGRQGKDLEGDCDYDETLNKLRQILNELKN